jgi:glycosyltransferase involved in cell wall biosynthesis
MGRAPQPAAECLSRVTSRGGDSEGMRSTSVVVGVVEQGPDCADLRPAARRLASVPMESPGTSPQTVLSPEGGATPWADTVVIVRVFNEAPVVGGVISELISAGLSVIAVDDASTDESAAEIEKAGAFRVSHPINLGAGGALQTGFEAALQLSDAQFIACFDADGQHQLADLLGMIEKIREGYDVVLGSRFLEDAGPTQMSWPRRVILRTAARLLNRRGGVKLTDAHNGLRVVARHVAADVRLSYAGMAYASQLEEFLTRPEYRITEFPVHILYTEYSRSKGQPLLNSVNILAEVAAHRITEWGRR